MHRFVSNSLLDTSGFFHRLFLVCRISVQASTEREVYMDRHIDEISYFNNNATWRLQHDTKINIV